MLIYCKFFFPRTPHLFFIDIGMRQVDVDNPTIQKQIKDACP